MKQRNNGKSILDRNFKRYDLTNTQNYEDAYPTGEFRNDIEKIMEIPGKEDMAGVFIRGVFKDERQLNAAVRLYHRHVKFKDNEHQELLRVKIAGTPAIGGVSRLDALFTAVQLLASDMYRTARGMPKHKGKGPEQVVSRASDFRKEEQQPSSLGVG